MRHPARLTQMTRMILEIRATSSTASVHNPTRSTDTRADRAAASGDRTRVPERRLRDVRYRGGSALRGHPPVHGGRAFWDIQRECRSPATGATRAASKSALCAPHRQAGSLPIAFGTGSREQAPGAMLSLSALPDRSDVRRGRRANASIGSSVLRVRGGKGT